MAPTINGMKQWKKQCILLKSTTEENATKERNAEAHRGEDNEKSSSKETLENTPFIPLSTRSSLSRM